MSLQVCLGLFLAHVFPLPCPHNPQGWLSEGCEFSGLPWASYRLSLISSSPHFLVPVEHTLFTHPLLEYVVSPWIHHLSRASPDSVQTILTKYSEFTRTFPMSTTSSSCLGLWLAKLSPSHPSSLHFSLSNATPRNDLLKKLKTLALHCKSL